MPSQHPAHNVSIIAFISFDGHIYALYNRLMYARWSADI